MALEQQLFGYAQVKASTGHSPRRNYFGFPSNFWSELILHVDLPWLHVVVGPGPGGVLPTPTRRASDRVVQSVDRRRLPSRRGDPYQAQRL